jgi:hypothetical protein
VVEVERDEHKWCDCACTLADALGNSKPERPNSCVITLHREHVQKGPSQPLREALERNAEHHAFCHVAVHDNERPEADNVANL